MYKLLLCHRYLRTRYIALASIISVTLGVATMIVVNSVMAGFSTQMKSRIHGILADLVMEAVNADGTAMPTSEILNTIYRAAGEDIEAASPTVEMYGMISFRYLGEYITRPVQIIGIDPKTKAQVGTLVSHLESHQETRYENEQGQTVVVPPRRKLTDIPGWDLLPEQQELRSHKLRELQLRQSMQQPAPNAELGIVAKKQEQGVEGDAEPGEKQAEKGGDAAGDPLLEQMLEQPNAVVEAADPGAPLPARCYIGSSLVRFPYKDPHTNKVRMVSMVVAGDDVTLSTVTAGRPPAGAHFDATVVDVFHSGMSEYDSLLVFMNIEELQKNRGMVDPKSGQGSVTSVQIRLKPGVNPKKVVENLRAAFPPGMFTVRTWEQKQGPLLAAVAVETAILNVLLFLIIAVAGFGILAIFFMIVVEKTRDIGILKALGAHSSGVMTIFLSYGLGLGFVGAGAGVALGLLFVWRINDIEAVLTRLTGIEIFDERIYYFPEIPTHVEAGMVLWVACGAILIAVMASILPARRAARLHPVQALRYE